MDQQVQHDPSYFEDELEVEEVEFMSDKDILKICEREIELAEEYHDDELEANREQALAYYFGDPRGDETEGNSETQSMDVADMVEATLAEVMPLYSHHRIANFPPFGPQDSEDQAQMEASYCNHVFMELNAGYTVLYSAVKDALLQKNGIVEIYVDEHADVEYDEYQNLNDFEIQELLSEEPNKKKEVIEAVQNEDGSIDLTIKTLIHVKELIAEAVAPEDFLFAVNHNSPHTKGIRFCGRRLIISKSDLIAQGYDKDVVDDLKEYDGDKTETKRNRGSNDGQWNTADDSTTLVEAYRCYVMMDYDGDGIAELHRVIICEGELLERSFAKFVPFASGSPFIMSHKFMGMSLFDKLKNIQDQKTAFIRQYINNATQMNNRRLEVLDGQVNLEDVLNSRAGGVVRTKVKGAVSPIPVDDIGPSCITALEYLDKVRAERGGASLDMQSAELQLGGNAAHATERQYTSKEKMAALMSRTLAETLIRQIYLIIHATLREYFTDEYPLLYGNEWKQVQPTTWLKRELLKIDVGMSAGEREKKLGTLHSNLELQIKAMELGSEDVLTSRKNIYNTITDILNTAGIDNHGRYWIDPESPQAKQALIQKQKSAQEGAKKQEEMNRMMFEYQRTIEDNKDEINMLKEENKNLMQDRKLAQDIIKHNDKMKLDWARLEKEYKFDAPGEGINESAEQ